MADSARPFRLGDRVRVSGWEVHDGREGAVVDSSPGYDTVYVLFDDEREPNLSRWPENDGREVAWSVSAAESSLELVEGVERRLSLTPYQLSVWDELEAYDAWQRDGTDEGWGPWKKAWFTPHAPQLARALNVLADKGLVAREGGRRSAKLPSRYRVLCWDPRQAPKG